MIIPPSSLRSESAWPSTPADFAELYLDVASQASRLLARHMKRQARAGRVLSAGELGVAKAAMDLSVRLLSNPFRLARTQIDLMRDHLQLAQGALLKGMGLAPKAAISVTPDDPRFADEAWNNHFLFEFIKQSYLITVRRLHQALADTDTAEGTGHDRPDTLGHRSADPLLGPFFDPFLGPFLDPFLDALSPSNFALTNPAVWRETLDSRGRNLIKGLKRLLNDLQEDSLPLGKNRRLGKELATTPGQIIFENELLQLIQYAPTTTQQWSKPLLIIPPWQHKYYLFDLSDEYSFVQWTTAQGYTTFIISWVDPDAGLAGKTFDDYLIQGVLAAIRAIQQTTGERKIHLLGYCLGGTLLMATLAYMAARRDYRAASATFLASILDFSADGHSPQTAVTCPQKRTGDLAWSLVINHYLLGKDRLSDDLLHWNADLSRLPSALQADYVDRFLHGNALAQPGSLSVNGVALDVRKVKVPCYFLAAADDQVAHWASVYLGIHLPRGTVRFVLGESGHLAGIVNPPAFGRYGYWTRPDLPDTASEFLTGAIHHQGSWWNDWHEWLLTPPDRPIDARQPGAGKLKVIEGAPGRYVCP
ncbi:MAG TPA: class I poly(R)-hydroxyalkanoic acid synthase [Accumulibacter sp.]|nr:class I poly(R)-hydroxyalkanoic acid synthase [Accumulibacter sp.]HMW19076.1 class I poly(R)-hydroxyalkanoic acid synthase [Accumulibacter sp.]HMX23697.1 class I poly(R)-hydroxyalkanoic acid synthase [Accumulibacter sp.]HMY07415.1 class I poly(R)-hydroxyalkanoic acid synthase [Accumulibacter sp.]HNC19126.1 class I poly(R)-hydroxyalkanoic acid synthase [Accumulibacter sp.]